jgi:hypothetical protein
MDLALRSVVVEPLRARGFSGSLPHLRRRLEERVDLLSVQFNSAGGSFVVEVASCGSGGFTTPWGKLIEPSRVRAVDIDPRHRPRLGSGGFPGGGDHWFVFGTRNYEVGSEEDQGRAHYEAVAAEVMRLLDEQAEPFWGSFPPTDQPGSPAT